MVIAVFDFYLIIHFVREIMLPQYTIIHLTAITRCIWKHR